MTGPARCAVGSLTREGVHRREVLSTVALAILAGLVQEGAVPIVALFVAQEGRAVLGRAVLCPGIPSACGRGQRKKGYLITYRRTRSPLADPSTAAMHVAASLFLVYVT